MASVPARSRDAETLAIGEFHLKWRRMPRSLLYSSWCPGDRVENMIVDKSDLPAQAGLVVTCVFGRYASH